MVLIGSEPVQVDTNWIDVQRAEHYAMSSINNSGFQLRLNTVTVPVFT